MTRRTLLTAAALAPAAALAQETTVAEIIQRQGLANVWASVQRMAQSSAGWLLIAEQAAFPECLQDACDSLGLRTVGQVEAFVARCSLSYTEARAFFPRVTLPDARTATAGEIDFEARDQFSITRLADRDFVAFATTHGDAAYMTVPASHVAELAASFRWRNAAFAERKQCEHLVTLFKGECVRMGLAGRAIGLAGLDLFDVGRFALAHAVPFVYCDDRKFRLIDAGRVLPAGHSKFAGCPQNITYSKLRWIYL